MRGNIFTFTLKIAAFLLLLNMLGGIAASQQNSRLSSLDAVVEQAIENHEVPGAVLLVGHDGQVIYRKAFGKRSLEPTQSAMTVDTIFDIASLTKVVATTTSVMQLVDQGKVRLNDPVIKYIPEFGQNDKDDITVRDLLTHHSGLAPDVDLSHPWSGRDVGYQMAFAAAPLSPAGARFVYSDINFIVLGAVVEHVTEIPLDSYCAQNIFVPLAMSHTRYRPPAEWLPQIASTEY